MTNFDIDSHMLNVIDQGFQKITVCFSFEDRNMSKNMVLNENYLINHVKYQFSLIKMQHCILTVPALNIYKKRYPIVGV